MDAKDVLQLMLQFGMLIIALLSLVVALIKKN